MYSQSRGSFGTLFTKPANDYNAAGPLESPFMWPSLNKALYCGAGEVAVMCKTKWTSQLGICGKICLCTALEQTLQGSIKAEQT